MPHSIAAGKILTGLKSEEEEEAMRFSHPHGIEVCQHFLCSIFHFSVSFFSISWISLFSFFCIYILLFTCTLSGYIAGIHAATFENFNNFTPKCWNVLFYFIYIIFGDTLWFSFALFNGYIASYQVSHYLL